MEGLPLVLRAYRALSMAAVPFANALLSHRLKRGREHALRLNERRGETALARPQGPLVWIHGASVGELTAIIPLSAYTLQIIYRNAVAGLNNVPAAAQYLRREYRKGWTL